MKLSVPTISTILTVMVTLLVLSIIALVVAGAAGGMGADIGKTILGNFIGSAFSFVFLVLGAYLAIMREKVKKHYDTMRMLDIILLDNQATVFDNYYALLETVERLKNEIAFRRPVAYSPNYCTIHVQPELMYDLLNLELANGLLELTMSAKRINLDLEVMYESFAEFRKKFIGLHTPSQAGSNPQAYLQNLNEYFNNLQLFVQQGQRFLPMLERQMLQTLALRAKLRFCQKQPTLYRRMFPMLTREHDVKIPQSAIADDLAGFRTEILDHYPKEDKYYTELVRILDHAADNGKERSGAESGKMPTSA